VAAARVFQRRPRRRFPFRFSATRERIGFRWKGATLQLFEVTGKKAPYKCKAAPFAVLTRQ
jgi:hypothetical protein